MGTKVIIFSPLMKTAGCSSSKKNHARLIIFAPLFFAAATPRHPGVMKETCAGSGVDLAVRGKTKIAAHTLHMASLFFHNSQLLSFGAALLFYCRA
jgi:hypothetical protein